MNDVFFGLSEQYDSGSDPAVALNASGTVLELHKNQEGMSLYYRVGQLDNATVQWTAKSTTHDGGTQPDCALNIHNVAVEVHKNEAGDTLYSQVGLVNPDSKSVQWHGAKKIGGGYTPSVSLNDLGVVVEVHRTNNVLHSDRLYIRVGKVEGESIVWQEDDQYGSGYFPRVALNNSGTVLVVHQADNGFNLCMRVGRVSGKVVVFEGEAFSIGNGTRPCVAITDDGTVIATWSAGGELWQRVGNIQGSGVNWTREAMQFDDGICPSVAAAGGMVLQVHQSETVLSGLFFSNSILTNRAIWMEQRLAALGSKPISALALPASHDSSMYRTGPKEIWAKTQDLSIYDQLEYGIRWFDLRVRWTGSKFVMHHGPIDGPDLADILADFQQFAEQGHKELAILKFSHFEDISNDIYTKLTSQVFATIGVWMIKTKPSGKRLAQGTLNEYTINGTALMVVVDDNYAIDKPSPGFWVYRDADWDADKDHFPGYDPIDGDLRVYDVYSDTVFLDTMIAGQTKAFSAYNGMCAKNPLVTCDLYLMSWTLTPPTDVWDISKSANRCLGQKMTTIPDPNSHGKIINMVYTDYVEYARACDVVLFMNGTPFAQV
jgi:hypothetical protein